jgi:hypothetical protein
LGWLRQWWWALALGLLFLGVVIESLDRPYVAVAPLARRVDSLESEVKRQKWERAMADSQMQVKIDAALLLLGGAVTKGETR